MAKDKNKLDQFFKENLIQDNVKPSKLAWERLESQLPQQEKSRTPIIWWAIAASVTVLLVSGYFAFNNPTGTSEQQFLATGNENLIDRQEKIQDPPIQEVPVLSEEIPTTEEATKTKPTISSTNKSSNQINSPSSNLIAKVEEKQEVKNTSNQSEEAPILEQLDLPQLQLPNLQVNQTVAINDQAKVEEPAFRVKIYSDGLEEDKTLINGISKKVDKVEGLLSKVDQGFADLQDAKSNLFTTLLSKKERPAEKP